MFILTNLYTIDYLIFFLQIHSNFICPKLLSKIQLKSIRSATKHALHKGNLSEYKYAKKNLNSPAHNID